MKLKNSHQRHHIQTEFPYFVTQIEIEAVSFSFTYPPPKKCISSTSHPFNQVLENNDQCCAPPEAQTLTSEGLSRGSDPEGTAGALVAGFGALYRTLSNRSIIIHPEFVTGL